jgi:hypothetical protein
MSVVEDHPADYTGLQDTVWTAGARCHWSIESSISRWRSHAA